MTSTVAIDKELKKVQFYNDCFVVPTYLEAIQENFDSALIKFCTELYVAAKNLDFEECDKITKKISDMLFDYNEGKLQNEN
jgi:hypothetical protein